MKPLRLSLLALTCALASACATTGTNPTSAPPPVDAPVVADDAVAQSAAPQAATDTVEATTEPTTPAPDAVLCPHCREGHLRRVRGKNGYFWGCSNYPRCTATFDDDHGKPALG